MKIAVLDKDTLTEKDDICFSVIESLGEVRYCSISRPEDIILQCADCEAILCNKIPITRGIMDSLPALRYVGLFATGYNNVDISAAREKGIAVCNVPCYSGRAVAQHTLALILHFASAVHIYDQSVRRGDWSCQKKFSFFPYPTYEIAGKTLGVFGYGDIGKKVALAGSALGMNVLVHTRTLPKDCPYELTDEEGLFRRSDYLTLHCPLTPQTENLINAVSLRKMKKTAVLINTARGGLIDENALAQALRTGIIAGAGLDTLRKEPPDKDNPLIGLSNCVITPHVAWAPRETRARLLDCVADNLRAYADGCPVNDVTKLH